MWCSVLQFGLHVTDIAASVLARMGGGVAGVLQVCRTVYQCDVVCCIVMKFVERTVLPFDAFVFRIVKCGHT